MESSALLPFYFLCHSRQNVAHDWQVQLQATKCLSPAGNWHCPTMGPGLTTITAVGECKCKKGLHLPRMQSKEVKVMCHVCPGSDKRSKS